MWDLPGPGLEPVSPALAGGFLTTAPPGKPTDAYLNICLSHCSPVCLFLYFISQNNYADQVICFSSLGGSLSYREEMLSGQAFSHTEDSPFILSVIEANVQK